MKKNKKIIIITSAILTVCILSVITTVIILSSKSKKVNEKKEIEVVVSQTEESLPEESQPEEIVESKPVDNGIELVFSSPKATNLTVTEPFIAFAGSCDPEKPLTVNDKEIQKDANGTFSYQPDLHLGINEFTFKHKEKTVKYTVNYRFVLIKSYSPSSAGSYYSGAVIAVSTQARRGSNVTATLGSQTVTLSPDDSSQTQGDFITYKGLLTLPDGNTSDINLGVITFKATYGENSEVFKSGSITCKKAEIKVAETPNVTPIGGRYIDVGSGYIAEIIDDTAETFDGKITDAKSIDWSRPTNNYLPKGTVDYCSKTPIVYETGSEKQEYTVLRAGLRVYTKKKDKPHSEYYSVVKQYAGELPDHNEISVASFEKDGDGRHSVLTLDCLWKAPFYFELKPQNYYNPSNQDYRISAQTFNYVEITLCYATVFTGELSIDEDNPLFSSAEIIKNSADYTLRLHLKKQGGFYGWDSYYNDKGQLCFSFLNPKTVTAGENDYGVNLEGVKVLIDVGHGGMDIGAPGFDSKNHSEAIQNLVLANKIKEELEKTGATVYLTRTGNTTSSTNDKIKIIREIKPDYCIAIHHDSGSNSNLNGFSAYYHHPFSMNAAQYVLKETAANCGGIYSNIDSLKWHYYFMTRSTVCPVVLTENGYISNKYDYQNIVSENINSIKAKAIVKGIADYFLSISQT